MYTVGYTRQDKFPAGSQWAKNPIPAIYTVGYTRYDSTPDGFQQAKDPIPYIQGTKNPIMHRQDRTPAGVEWAILGRIELLLGSQWAKNPNAGVK